MTTNRPRTVLLVLLASAGVGLAACSTGIDIGQVTGGTSTGGVGDGGLLVTPSKLDLGAAVAQTTVTRTVVLSNTSTAEIDGITVSTAGDEPQWFAASNVPTSLAAGAQATVSVSFRPNNGISQAQAVLVFSGTDVAPAGLDLTAEPVFGSALQLDTSALNFGYQALTTTTIACTAITNAANIPVTITGTTNFTNQGGAFSLASTDDATPPNPFSLPLTIAAGGSAKVCFEFTPPITQEYYAQVTLVTDDPSGFNPTITLTGWGGGPQIKCTPPGLDFGATAFGSTPSLKVTCENIGSSISGGMGLTLGALTSSSSAFSVQLTTTVGPDGLAPGESATINVSYLPSGNGTDTGTLQIDSNGGQGQPVSIALSGTGTALEVDPGTLNFGFVPLETEVIECSTITDGEGAAVTINGVSDVGWFSLETVNDAGQEVPLNDFPIAIAAGGSAQVCFGFEPGFTLSATAEATLLTSAPNVDAVIQLTAWGGGPQIFCTPPSLDFGFVDAGGPFRSANRQVMCSNSGSAIPGIGLDFGDLTTSSHAFGAEFETDVSDAGLAPGETVIIDVDYQPSGEGVDTGTLHVNSNGGQGQPVSISLSGSGT